LPYNGLLCIFNPTKGEFVYRLGEAIVDNDTGQVPGSEEEKTGVLKIIEVKEKYATATAAGGGKIEKGDVIREE